MPKPFFLAYLAVWTCFPSTITPNVLAHHVSGHKGVPSSGILTEMFSTWFAGIDCFLLAAVAYSHHVAICHPLHSATSGTPQL